VSKTKQLPLNKRWPGQYAARLRVYTPKGTMLEFETHLPADYAGELLNEFSRAIGGEHPRKPSDPTKTGGQPATLRLEETEERHR
jgi:hypothetical protein